MINKVILLGNVGADPDIRQTANGDNVANFSLATSEQWKDKSGEKQTKTEWHRVVVFGKLADVVSNYVKKGAKLYIEGAIQTRKWTDTDGNDRYNTEIILNGFGGVLKMLSSNNDVSEQHQRQEVQKPKEPEVTFDDDDDIPF